MALRISSYLKSKGKWKKKNVHDLIGSNSYSSSIASISPVNAASLDMPMRKI